MNIEKTFIEDLLVITPKIFKDERGYFYESWNFDKFTELGIDASFVQDNESLSQKGVIRGLHFQKSPFTQGKLVRVIKGSVIDVTVDLRKNSKTYGKYFSIELSETNKKMLWIPPQDFAHGFATLQNNTIFSYKCTDNYQPKSEICILWNSLNIDWKIKNPIISEKDAQGISFENYESN